MKERRTVAGTRLIWRRVRLLPLRTLAAVGAITGMAGRADREIAAVTAGCLFEHVSEVMPFEVAIVPGAYVSPDGTPSDMLADRLTAALALYEAGKVTRVLVSGGPDEVEGMVGWLAQRGVTAVIADPLGLRTWMTMQRAVTLGVTRAVVCTQRFHLPRSLYLAHAAGIEAVGLVADAGHYRGGAFNTSREACARMRALVDVRRARAQVKPPG